MAATGAIGGGAHEAELLSLHGIDLAGLRAGEASQLLVRSGHGLLLPANPVLGQVAYESLGEIERQEMHAALAICLQERSVREHGPPFGRRDRRPPGPRGRQHDRPIMVAPGSR